ncbi:MAG: translation initiation factor IF-2 N-terminal domain-containing protein, partial [Candidatus Krumholzibacteriota bacterium]|nr:translation initiation factor IF-2 N-terminal domain-containing protein [Candidatus Krumholzibacteriota bacterium]
MLAKRIYQVAKALGIKGTELAQYLRDQGFEVKSHMEVITPEQAALAEKQFKPAKKAAAKKA